MFELNRKVKHAFQYKNLLKKIF